MTAFVMETEIMWKIGKSPKMNETLCKCHLACKDLHSIFGIFKLTTVAIETVQTSNFSKFFEFSENLQNDVSWG